MNIKKALNKKLEEAEKELFALRKVIEKNSNQIKRKVQLKIDSLDKRTNGLCRIWENGKLQRQRTKQLTWIPRINWMKLASTHECLETDANNAQEILEEISNEISLVQALLKLDMEDHPLSVNHYNTVERRRDAVHK